MVATHDGVDHHLTAFEPATGAEVWSVSLGAATASLSAPVMLGEGDLLLIRGSTVLRVAEGGGTVSSYPMPGSSGGGSYPVVDATDTVYVIAGSGHLVAFAAADGSLVFDTDLMNLCPTWYQPAILPDGAVFVNWTQHVQTWPGPGGRTLSSTPYRQEHRSRPGTDR